MLGINGMMGNSWRRFLFWRPLKNTQLLYYRYCITAIVSSDLSLEREYKKNRRKGCIGHTELQVENKNKEALTALELNFMIEIY
jgi:hypothetical protein